MTGVLVGHGTVYPLLSSVIATGAGSSVKPVGSNRTFQAHGTTSAGAGAATIVVQVSNNDSDWITLGTISLTLSTTSSSDGFASDAPWKYVRGNVTAISGTDATVSLILGM